MWLGSFLLNAVQLPFQIMPIIFQENISGFDAYRNLVRSKHEVEGQYLTDVYTKEAVRTITSHGNPSTPLFLVISHLAPHTGAAGVLEVRDEAENSKKFGHISDPARRLYAGSASISSH